MSSWTMNLADEVERMRREMDRLLDSVKPSGWTFPFSRISFLPGRAARAYPLLNVGEDADSIHIHALAPGIDPKTLDVSITGNQLSISGEKKPANEGIRPEALHRSERAAGRFVRTVSLTADVDAARVQAAYSDGLLRITLPKAETAKPKKISVSVS